MRNGQNNNKRMRNRNNNNNNNNNNNDDSNNDDNPYQPYFIQGNSIHVSLNNDIEILRKHLIYITIVEMSNAFAEIIRREYLVNRHLYNTHTNDKNDDNTNKKSKKKK